MNSHIQQSFRVIFDFVAKIQILIKILEFQNMTKNSKVNERVTDRERVADRGNRREKKFALGRKFN